MKRRAAEEYEESIYLLEKKDGRAQTGKIASEMDVKQPSVTRLLQKLQSKEWQSMGSVNCPEERRREGSQI